MKFAAHILFVGGLFFFVGVSTAFATVNPNSSDPSHAAGFEFYCQPYSTSFVEGGEYIPKLNDAICDFSVPSTIVGNRVFEIYRGTVGSATFVGGGITTDATYTLYDEYPNSFAIPYNSLTAPEPGTQFFAVVYDKSLKDTTTFRDYLSHGSALPAEAVEGENFFILRWKWGSEPKTPDEYDPVVIIPGILGSWEKNGEWVLDPITHIYDNLVDTFLANGYVEGQTLFKFPYDWEEPNETTAHLLANKIEEIKQICGCSKVDIIAHSMGGLVASQYIESSEYAGDVDQLFLVATPLMGAPKAYKTWEAGEVDFGRPIENAVMQVLFKNWAAKAGYGVLPGSVYNYIHNGPIASIQELLPVYDYLYDSIEAREYPNGYPINGFLENLTANFATVESRADVQVVEANVPGQSTTAGFVVEQSTQFPKWEHGEPMSTIFSAGDGTVPQSSIEDVVAPAVVFDNTSHTGVVSSGKAYIFEELNNKVPDSVVDSTYNPASSFLYFELFSPIDMQIVAPDGKRLGKDFESNTEVAEIPDAFYSGFNTDNEYAIILNPLPGTYKVETIGTGQGEYTIVADYSDLATTGSAMVAGTTTLGELSTAVLMVSSTSTDITLTPEVSTTSTPSQKELTPDTCVSDLAQAYASGWIGKKSVYNRLVTDCRLLKGLFAAREKLEEKVPAKHEKLNKMLLKVSTKTIERVLSDMDKLAEDKKNAQEAKDLIRKYTAWFREHEL